MFCGYCRNPDTTGGACTAPNDVCQQRTQGAFGRNGAGVKTISVVGSGAGSIVDGLPHLQTLASVFCIPPTGNAVSDAGADLPGPAAIPLKDFRQLCSTAQDVLRDVADVGRADVAQQRCGVERPLPDEGLRLDREP